MGIAGADIQPDKNWAKVHNGILEILAQASFTNHEFRCLLYLIRKTYGYGKKEDAISLSQWEEGTGIARPHISKTLKKLAAKNVIIRTGGGRGRGRTAIYSFNKYHEQWQLDAKKVHTGVPITKVHTGVPNSAEKVHTGVPEKVHTGVPTKERRKLASFVAVYEKVWGLLPSQADSDEIVDWSERVTVDGWEYALNECRDSNKVGMWKYLRGILRRLEREGYQPANVTEETTNTLDFTLEELA